MVRTAPAGRLRTAALPGLLLALAAACHPAPPASAPALRAPAEGAAAPGGHTFTGREGAAVARAEELLEGRFAGVQVLRLAGGGVAVRIRGTTSVLGSNEPLYVLDGMPITPGPGGALAGINPADIARIEVLKDVGATSFYGVRGANGVVLITTRWE